MTRRARRLHLLDEVLPTGSHLAVLRVLTYHAGGVSARSMSRACGVNHDTCARIMSRLLALGILRPTRSPRKLELNFDHPLVKDGLLPLFRHEERLEFEGMTLLARGDPPI